MGSGIEKRGAIRLSERCKVAYRVLVEGADSPKRRAAETLNLSASGVCIRTEESLRPDDHVALELTLAERDPGEAVVAVGKVVWCDRDGDHFRIGACFTWLREEDRRDLGIIADYVARRVARRVAGNPQAGDSESTT